MLKDTHKVHEGSMTPIQAEAYFDNALTQEDLANYSRDERDQIERGPLFAALGEMRDTMRTDIKYAIGDIDGVELLDAIHKTIDRPSEAYHQEGGQWQDTAQRPARRTSPIVRWIPAMVAAALFVLSLPGLISLLSHDLDPHQDLPPAQTIVYMNDPASAHVASCPQSVTDHIDPTSLTPTDDQLTVREMDHAIHLLIRRIESLEEVNRVRVERGELPVSPKPEKVPVTF